ncbi:Gfo/Idh/MocA family oxidoreductase [Rhodoferax sp.]|uniref:Gfo/Idh/MocA family oxidoreductase n=1 Tax=Rhodoferax sp. TaxID=50421 RepID=UPI003BB7357F
MADPDIEAIYNPLPNDQHVAMTLAAARAGKHVLCGKPFAMNAREAEAPIEAAGRFWYESEPLRPVQVRPDRAVGSRLNDITSKSPRRMKVGCHCGHRPAIHAPNAWMPGRSPA